MTVSVFKVLLVGDPNVGKSSLIRRMLLDEFDEEYQATVGVDMSAIAIDTESDKPSILTVIDLGGQKDFTDLRTHYYRNAHFSALVFDISKRETFDALPDWHQGMNIALGLGEDKILAGLLIGNKCDMDETREISSEEAEKYAKSLGWQYIETSAKTGQNVVQVFTQIGSDLTTALGS